MAVKTTAKAFVSGYDYKQDLNLEAGVYTLMTKVKSMYGNVVSFALRDEDGWKDYDLDTVQGEWKWSYVTFRILKEVKEINLISRYYSDENPVYFVAPQLIAGNVPINAGASPFDLDQVTDDLHDFVESIADFTNEEFHDRVIDAGERVSLIHDLDNVNIIVESVKGSYNKLIDNPFIHEDTMTSITTRYNDFIASWISDGDPLGLKPVILSIVNGDDIISQNEQDEKDRALNAFNLALYEYNQAEKEVYNDVGENSIAPKIIDGFWAFWDSELQEFVPSEFSAEGDDGHSPYVDVLTGTWWEWDDASGNYKDTELKAEGKDGISITLVDVQYAVNTSSTTPPIETSDLWKTLADTLTGSQQLWTRTKTTYSSGDPTYSTPANITPKIGADGNSITSITEWYYLSTSKTELTGGSWSTTPWTWVYGMFMWTKTVFTYSKTDDTETLPIVSSEWEAIDDIEIDGRNLMGSTPVTGMLNTETGSSILLNYADGVTTRAHSIISGGATGIFRFQITYQYPISTDGWYTVSFKYKHVDGLDLQLAVNVNMQQAGSTIERSTPDDTWHSWSGSVYVNQHIGQFGIVDFEQTGGNWFNVLISDLKVEKGKIATAWSMAPEDVNTKLTALDYLKQAMQGSTDVQGGLLSTSVVFLKTLTQVVGGMSGLVSDPVAMWTGGTYVEAQADALKSFKSAMVTGGMDKKDGAGHRAKGNFAWSEQGDVYVRGLIEALSGLIGNFKIADGNIVGYNTDGSECLRIAIEDIPLPSTLETGAWADLSSFDLEFSGNADNTDGQGTYQGIRFGTSTLINLVLPYATKVKFVPLLPTVSFSDPASVVDDTYSYRLRVYAVGNPYAVFDAVYTNQEITLPAGTYDIELELTFYITCASGDSTDFTISLNPANKLQYQESVRKSAFGRNGFYSYFSAQEYLMFRSGLGLVAKGNTNLPGVLAAGTINSDGSRDSFKKWGAKNSQSNVSKSGAGVYIIPHAVGHANYMVYITPAAGDRTYYVTNKTSTTFTVVLRAGGSNSDTTFDYVVVGAN